MSGMRLMSKVDVDDYMQHIQNRNEQLEQENKNLTRGPQLSRVSEKEEMGSL